MGKNDGNSKQFFVILCNISGGNIGINTTLRKLKNRSSYKIFLVSYTVKSC